MLVMTMTTIATPPTWVSAIQRSPKNPAATRQTTFCQTKSSQQHHKLSSAQSQRCQSHLLGFSAYNKCNNNYIYIHVNIYIYVWYHMRLRRVSCFALSRRCLFKVLRHILLLYANGSFTVLHFMIYYVFFQILNRCQAFFV